MANINVKLFQIRRSYTAGYRPPTTGATALKAGETLRNYADKVDLHGIGDGTWIEQDIRAMADQLASGPLATALSAKASNASVDTKTDAKWPGHLALKQDATTDDGPALIALANTVKTIVLRPGATMRIASNVAIDARLVVPKGAFVVIENNVTLIPTGGIEADHYQVFVLNGTNAKVLGLPEAKVDWFCPHRNTANDCIVSAQSAYDAVADSGTVNWGIGYYTAAGGTIQSNRGQKSRTQGGKWGTQIRWSTGACNFIRVSGTVPHGSVEGFRFVGADFNLRPTSGKAIWISIGNTKVTDIDISAGWDAIYLDNFNFGSRISHINIGDCRSTGIWCNQASDCFVSNFISASLGDTCTVTGQSGTFQIGEGLTISGTPYNGTVLAALSGGRYRLQLPIKPTPGTTTVTGKTSNASATISAIAYDFENGNIRLEGQCEAVIMHAGDVIGGNSSLATTGTAFLRGQCPGFCRFTDVFFDSAHAGLRISRMGQSSFIGCWSWNHGDHAIVIGETKGLKFIGCDIGAGRGWGVVANGNNKRWGFWNCSIALNDSGGIVVNSDNEEFWIMCNAFGENFALAGATQTGAVTVNSGTTNFYIKYNSLNLNGGKITDNSGAAQGTAKDVGSNFG